MANGPYSEPWTDTGRLHGDVDSLNSIVDSLECTCRDLRYDVDEILRQLNQLQENFKELLNVHK